MDIFQQLGVNHTVWIQFVLFVVSIWILQKAVFQDFAQAAFDREQRTRGSEDRAVQFAEKTKILSSQYETEARALNDEVKKHFEQARKEASKKVEEFVQTSRHQSQKTLEETRARVAQELHRARDGASREVPEVVASIIRRMLGSGAQPKGWQQ